jgi:hypothetical protein
MMETNTGEVGGTGASMHDDETGATPPAQGAGMIDRGKERVLSSVDDQKIRVARTLGAVASSLKSSGAEMHTGDAAAIGGVVERVADQIDRAATYLERSDVEEIVGGVERFARRNPALFIGAAFAVGVLGARFLKSSRARQASGFAGGMDTPVPYGERDVTSRPVGSADLATGTSGTGAVTGRSDLATGLE